MRRASPFLFFLLAALVAPCEGGCGSGAEHKTPPPAMAPIESSNADDESEGNATGHEGDDELLPERRAPHAESDGARAIHDEALRQLAHLQASTYSHKTLIDEGSGKYEYDCSGFVDYTVGNVEPDAFAQLRTATVKRPLAKHFVEFVTTIGPGENKGKWKRVARADQLVPGDIVAWLKPSDVVSRNTGHVMIVDAKVSRDVAHADTVVVPIIDSTSMRHGKADSRYSSKATGLGTGEVILLTNERGAPIGYRWSHGKKSREHATIVALAHLD
jgi:hypothetical protein